MKNVIGIDPGNKETAMCVFDGTRIVYCEKIDNKQFFQYLDHEIAQAIVRTECVHRPAIFIEDIQAMGMAVGQEVFDTAKMIGRIQQTLENGNREYNMVKRTEIKLHHCGTTRAKDTNIRQALIDRFGDKGTKKEPGFFFGISGNDQWSSCAIALYGHDKQNEI
jgi:hypothetical protein